MDRGAWWATVHAVTRVGHDWATSLALFTFMHWRRKWQPTPVFLPGESQGWGSLVGCRLWGRTESDMTEAAAAAWVLVAHMVKNLPATWATQVWSVGRGDALEKGMATHSRYSCLENSMGKGYNWWGLRVGHDWATKTFMGLGWGDSIFSAFYFMLEYSWLTVLWPFQVLSRETRPYIHTFPLSPRLCSHPGCQLTASRVPVPYSRSL